MKRAALLEAQGLRTVAKNCPDLLRIGKEKAPQSSSEGQVKVSGMAPQLHDLINKLSIGEVSQPILQRNGIGVIMVCSKDTPATKAETSRDEVFETLLKQKLDTISRRYLRDLRRASYVDVRV
jgi:peptidyl-prolyl cis-trans isomerase SurA